MYMTASMCAATVGWNSLTLAKSEEKKDTIIFISKEENEIPSKAKIVLKSIEEDRGPLLQNGDINWACGCIEREVVGPCNVEFRKWRELIHLYPLEKDADFSSMDPEVRNDFNEIMEKYILCTLKYPVYYKSALLEEERLELETAQIRLMQEEKKKQEEKEANKRHFGKDEVVFLTEAENSIPSTVEIPSREIEEFRDPLLPNGEINWSCTCIEHEVMGPCNVQFRSFYQYMHDQKRNEAEIGDAENDLKTEENIQVQAKLHSLMLDFFQCAKANTVYYAKLFKELSSSEDKTEKDIDEKDATVKDTTDNDKTER